MARQGFITTATLLLFLLVYFFGWYLPNRVAFDYMMDHQSGEFALSGKTWEYIRFNLNYHFIRGWFKWFVFIFLFFLLSGFMMMKRSRSGSYQFLFISSLVWFFLELHKLTMPYLPTRYQVSLFAAMGMLMSVVAMEILSKPTVHWKLVYKVAVLSLITILLSLNIWQYIDAINNRSYVIRDTNNYLSPHLEQGDIVLGAWAPSLTWNSRSGALPVWNHFLNDKDPLNSFNPKMIIAETDEMDSEQVWSGQGINLAEISDSTRNVRIGQWEVVMYWLKIED